MSDEKKYSDRIVNRNINSPFLEQMQVSLGASGSNIGSNHVRTSSSFAYQGRKSSCTDALDDPLRFMDIVKKSMEEVKTDEFK
jgi:hypothetical protein